MTPPSAPTAADPLNAHVADQLDEVAALLEEQKANPFRVQAYRNAAATVRALPRGVDDILDTEGLAGLVRLPTIGNSLARVIEQIATTGRLPMLERLRGQSDPIGRLASVPGIGPTLARRLHDELEIETLEQLERAAHDGTLRKVPGFGEKRIAAIRDVLATRLGRRGSSAAVRERAGEPPVAELLDVDREYRERSEAGTLPRIAPRRFNPTGERWLPVLHTSRGSRQYTALFSNTPRAHELGKTHDWVVIYFDDDRGVEGQRTVTTPATGPLRGKRVVRGREAESERYYAHERGEAPTADTD